MVQAKPTIPNPSFSNSDNKFACFKYSSTVFDPGAKEDLTQGFLCSPSSFAFFANRPAAIILRGLLVLVQLVIAAIIIAPSGMSVLLASGGTVVSRVLLIPETSRLEVATRRCGFEGPAILRTTFDRLNFKVRSY